MEHEQFDDFDLDNNNETATYCHNTNTNSDHDGRTNIDDEGNSYSSLVILHRIASYLSLGDAESMASSRPSGTARTFPGHHSLDYNYFYHSVRRVSPLATHSSSSDQHVNIIDSSCEKSEDEEDWFVGGQYSINSLGGCGTSSSAPTRLVTLLPLEEEFYDDPQQQQQQQESPWTPAGQATSEESEKESQNALNTSYTEQSQKNEIIDKEKHGRDSPFFIQRKRRKKKQELQNKLAAAVFSHPQPLRQYCLDAYSTALSLSMERQKQLVLSETQEAQAVSTGPTDLLFQHHSSCGEYTAWDPEKLSRGDVLHMIATKLLHSVPLSVLMEFTELTCDLSMDTLFAIGRIGSFTIDKCVSMLCDTAMYIAGVLSRVNPLDAIQFVMNAQRSAVGKTGDVLVSGIQSVATGVGSVSNAALNRVGTATLALAGGVVGGSRSSKCGSRSGKCEMGSNGFGRGRKDSSAGENPLESKLFHRLQKMESVSKLVAYSERRGEEAFSRHAKKRAQRMMHYNVSFMPFTATIQPSSHKKSGRIKHNVSFELDSESFRGDDDDNDNDSVSSESLNSSGSIFMRTPTSFPPTPTSRLYYFERGSQFTENVVFLARDQLRVERGVANHNEQTRAMSKALIDGSRLAVFDAANVGNGIALSCGQHIATKVGNALYCSTRSMIPAMRNSYVYFEISVSPSTTMNGPSSVHVPQVDATTLLVGLSTLEMPLDTLVGAWNGSVGLCSTGQILHSGQWFSLNNPDDIAYGSNCTVGCLVYLDDNTAYDTSEGPHVTVDVTFNINGRIVQSILCSGESSDQNSPDSSGRSLGAGGDGCEPTLSLIVPKAHELFPTVTLHSSGTSVMCRFSADDLLANSRSEIGAISGVVVYAVDGSVILDENEDDEFLLDSSSHCNEFFDQEVAL